MQLAMGDWDETAESRHKDHGENVTRRWESLEAQRRLDQFAHPEDSFDEIYPQDAHHDLQMSLYRSLARMNCLF